MLGCDLVGGSSECCLSEFFNCVIVVVIIEIFLVLKDIDLCDFVLFEMCYDIDGDFLCNNVEYDSINLGEERIVVIENLNYCSIC